MNDIRLQCNGCAYDGKSRCAAFIKRPVPCWNHTTIEQAKEREEEIRRYKQGYRGAVFGSDR